MAYSVGHNLPDEGWRWNIARETGWTLEYIDSLSLQDFHDYLQILDAEAKVKKHL